MSHDKWGNHYEFNAFDTIFIAVVASAIIGSLLSVIFAATHFALGWPHDIVKTCIICYAIPGIIVLGLGSGDD